VERGDLAADVGVVRPGEPPVRALDRPLVRGGGELEDAERVGTVERGGQGELRGTGAPGGYGAARRRVGPLPLPSRPGPRETHVPHDDPTTLATTAEERLTARRLWVHLEVVHVPQYFAPAVLEAHRGLGLALPWGGYSAGRIACMGEVGPEVATAVFYGFAPRLLQEALPAAWATTTPQEAHAATLAAIDATLAPALEPLADEVVRAAELARQAALLHPTVGRPLAAARARTPWPEAPHMVLFEAATRIRESRGEGHVASLVAAGIDGCESHLTLAGDSVKVRQVLQPRRGWTDAEWDAAIARLQERGLLTADGGLTPLGIEVRDGIERRTDALAVPPWRAFGAERTAQLLELLRPIARAVADTGIVPGVVTRRLDL
jgi:hypothetical protein